MHGGAPAAAIAVTGSTATKAAAATKSTTATEAALIAVAPRGTWASVATISAVASVAAVALAFILLAHHDGRFLVEIVDAHGQEPEDVGGNPHLALHLGDSLVRCLDVEKRVVRAAVFLDLVSGGLQTPIFGLTDLAAKLFDDGFIGVHKPCNLLRRDILARKEGMLIAWHIGLSLNSNEVRRRAPVKPWKGVKDLKQSRDTGTRALTRRGQCISFGNSQPLPFSLKPDGRRTIWKIGPAASNLHSIASSPQARVMIGS